MTVLSRGVPLCPFLPCIAIVLYPLEYSYTVLECSFLLYVYTCIYLDGIGEAIVYSSPSCYPDLLVEVICLLHGQ